MALSGNYTVNWTDREGKFGGNFIVHLVSTASDRDYDSLINSIFDAGTSHSGTTQVYNRNGQYYLDVVGGGDWTFTVSPF